MKERRENGILLNVHLKPQKTGKQWKTKIERTRALNKKTVTVW